MKRTVCRYLKRLNALLMTAPLLLGGAVPTMSATFNDPAWPCLQRKVENLSIGLMWPEPLDTETPQESLPDAAAELAETLALRRISVEEAEDLVTRFVETHPGADKQLYGRIFMRVFERLNRDRKRIISGIGTYSKKQIALAEKIDATRVRMDELMAVSAPDFDAVDKLEEQLDWDERIYHDRARSLTYVCETPVLLEKRLYAIAKLLSEPATK